MNELRALPYLCALVLAFAFALAAMAKWRDPAGTARGFRLLGLGRPWTLARLVPAVETALAGGLVVAPTWFAAPSLALLVAFTVFLVGRLRAGVVAACNCFGSSRSGPLSWADVTRNGWLGLAALVALTGSGPQRPSVAAIVLVALLTVVAAGSVRWMRQRARS